MNVTVVPLRTKLYASEHFATESWAADDGCMDVRVMVPVEEHDSDSDALVPTTTAHSSTSNSREFMVLRW